MVDLAYSKNMYKRIVFVVICVTLSVLLCVTLFPAQAIAKAREDFVYNFVVNEIGEKVSSNDVKDNADSKSAENVSDEESKSEVDESTQLSEPPSNEAEVNNSTESNINNADNDSINNSNSTYDEDISNESDFNDDESQEASSDEAALVRGYNANLLDSQAINNNQDDSVQTISGNDYKGENDVNDISLNTLGSKSTSSKNKNVPVINDPEWYCNSQIEGEKDKSWWKTEEEKQEEDIKSQEGGKGTKEDPFLVGTKETFMKLLQGSEIKADAPQKNAYIKLIADIDLSDADAAKEEDYKKALRYLPYSTFSGTLDGDNHQIFSINNSRTPLFYSLDNATILNLTLSLSVRYLNEPIDPLLSTDRMPNELGLLSSFSNGNLTIKDSTFAGNLANREDEAGYSSKRVGGIIGYAKGNAGDEALNFDNVKCNVNISCNGTARHYAGGFIGLCTEILKVNFKDCRNEGTVSTLSASSAIANIFIEYGKMFVAGILGGLIARLIYGAPKIEEKELPSVNKEEGIFTSNSKDDIEKVQQHIKKMENSPTPVAVTMNDSENFANIDSSPVQDVYDTEMQCKMEPLYEVIVNNSMTQEPLNINKIEFDGTFNFGKVKEKLNAIIENNDYDGFNKLIKEITESNDGKILLQLNNNIRSTSLLNTEVNNNNGDMYTNMINGKSGYFCANHNEPINLISINEMAVKYFGLKEGFSFETCENKALKKQLLNIWLRESIAEDNTGKLVPNLRDEQSPYCLDDNGKTYNDILFKNSKKKDITYRDTVSGIIRNNHGFHGFLCDGTIEWKYFAEGSDNKKNFLHKLCTELQLGLDNLEKMLGVSEGKEGASAMVKMYLRQNPNISIDENGNCNLVTNKLSLDYKKGAAFEFHRGWQNEKRINNINALNNLSYNKSHYGTKALKASNAIMGTLAKLFTIPLIGVATKTLTSTGILGSKSISPLIYIFSGASRQKFINDKNQNVGKIKINQFVKDTIKKIIKQSHNEIDNGTSEITDQEIIKALDDADLDNDKVLYSDNVFNKNLYHLIGDLFIKRFNALTGNEHIYWNVFQDKNSDNEEIKHLEDTSDFLALQGRLIYDNCMPIANVMSDEQYNAFIYSPEVNRLKSYIQYSKYESKKNDEIYNNYVELGKAYCSACVETQEFAQNKAYKQNMKFGLMAQNILQDSCFDLYCKERNITEDYYNEKLKEHKTSHASAVLRKFMNEDFSNQLEYLDFLKVWAPKLENIFLEKAKTAKILDDKDDNKDLTEEQKTDILKHFFITYLTYTGEFSYYNYLPLTRGVIMDRDEKLYKTDFEFSDYEIDENGCSQYVFSNESWKYTNKKPAIDFPLNASVLQECALYKDKESIDELLKCEYNEDDFNSDIGNYEDSSSNMNSIWTTAGGGIHSMFENAFRGLQEVASNIPRYDGSLFSSHYIAAAGGFIANGEDVQVSFIKCENTGSITGGDYAGGFMGIINDKKSSAYFDSCTNGGAVVAADESHHDPTVGGFIGRIKDKHIKVEFNKCMNTGIVASRRTAGGYVGTAGGAIIFSNCACMGGIAAPRYCGGYVGITDNFDVKYIEVDNCYSYSVFDGASNSDKTIDHAQFALSLLGIYIPSWQVNGQRDELNLNPPGALFGEWSNNITRVDNFFYLEGNDLIGRKQTNKVDVDMKNNCNVCSANEFSGGSIAYKLNAHAMEKDQTITIKNAPFGQAIDDLSKFEKAYIPIPNNSMPIYKNKVSEESIYTNYDPQYTELCKVNFDYHNATIGPDVLNINVKKKDDLNFSVQADESYQISNVWFEQLDDDNATLKQFNLSSVNGNNYNANYTLHNVKKNTTVHIETKEKELICPKGSGLDFDPYLISSREELLWLNKTLKENMNTNVHIKLTKDIDMSGSKWAPLFSQREGMGFNGSFDGGGHVIGNITIDTNGAESGAFFNGIEGGNLGGVFVANKSYDDSLENFLKNTDKNIAVPADCYDLLYYILNRFRGFEIDKRIKKYYKDDINKKSAEQVCLESLKNSTDNVGLCYFKYDKDLITDEYKLLDTSGEHGVIKNLTLDGNFIDGAFAKSARDAKFENCISSGTVSGNGKACGGLVALATKNVKFENCENRAMISFSAADTYYAACGGIVGSLTSMKYVYADASTSEDVDYTGGINYLDVEIKKCKNYGHISAGSTAGMTVDAGGIVGNMSEYDINYKASSDFSDVEKDTDKKKSCEMKAAYVLIDGCDNYVNVGDPQNTYSARCAGIIASVGYINSKQFYKCVVNNCSNSGHIGFDAGGYETATKGTGGICAYINSVHYTENDRKKTYEVNNEFVPITSNLESIQSSESLIYNCINYGNIRTVDDNDRGFDKFSGQILGSVGWHGASIKNCAMTGEYEHAIGYMMGYISTDTDRPRDVAVNKLYRKDTFDNDGVNYIGFTDEDLKNGKLTYDLMSVDPSLVENFMPSYGQNIDVTQANGHIYPRQFFPFRLNDITQKVYKRDSGKNYSPFGKELSIYTNVKVDNPDLNKDNSYKVNIKVKDENGFTDSKDVCYINGYVIVKKDDYGSANFDYTILGKNGYILDDISFGENSINVNNSSTYSFRVSNHDSILLLNNSSNSVLKSHIDDDGYVCFDLVASFTKEKKPKFVNGYYNISNILEFRWYAKHFNDRDACISDFDSPTGVWDALLTNDIYIDKDDTFDSIGNNYRFTGKFLGAVNKSELHKKILNKSNKPIFSEVGDNAYIANLDVEQIFINDKEDKSSNWNSTLIKHVVGHNVIVENVNTYGLININKVDFDFYAGALISQVGNDSVVNINNCINNLSITAPINIIGGFVGSCENATLKVNDSINNGNIYSTKGSTASVGGCVGRIKDTTVKNASKFNNFVNNAYIHTNEIENNSNFVEDKNQSNAGGIIGDYIIEEHYDYRIKVDKNVEILRCINNGDISSSIYCGGFVGLFKYMSSEHSSPSGDGNRSIKFKECENKGILNAIHQTKDYLYMGGMIGGYDCICPLNFEKCLLSGYMNVVKNTTKVGGLIGKLKCNKQVVIKNSSIVIGNAKEIKESIAENCGMLFALFDKDGNAENTAKLDNSYYLASDDGSLPYVIGGNNQAAPLIINNEDSANQKLDAYKSGKVAYLINKYCDNVLEDADEEDKEHVDKKWIIGQAIDKDVARREDFPHFASPVVNNPKENIYTNYEEKELLDRYIIHVYPSEKSSWKGIDAFYEFVEGDEEWDLPFGERADKYILTKLNVNGKIIENSESNGKSSFYELWKSYGSIFKKGLTDIKDIDKFLGNSIHHGFNDFEYCYEATREPMKSYVSVNYSRKDAYAITCAHEFQWIVSAMKENKMKYRYVSLEDSIDFSGFSWDEAIDNWNNCSLFGNNNKIYNISGKADAFIKNAENACFKDFNLDVDLHTESAKSAFIAYAHSNVILDSINVSGYVESSKNCEIFGGLVGVTNSGLNYRNLYYSKDENLRELLYFSPQDDEGYDFTAQSGNVIRNCTNKLNKITWAGFNKWSISAGIVGKVESEQKISDGGLYISNCVNYAHIQSTKGLGNEDVASGIVGVGGKSGNKISIYNCKNYGDINGFFAGGIFGVSGRNSDKNFNTGKYVCIKNCNNFSNISGKICGGILASSYSSDDNKKSTIAIESCMNTGNIFCKKSQDDSDSGFENNNRAGGIVGFITDDDGNGNNNPRIKYFGNASSRVTINHCSNLGVVNSNSMAPAGGIVGDNSWCYELRITNSYSADTIFNDNRWSSGCHSILGWTCNKGSLTRTLHNTYINNVYEVGPKNIGAYFIEEDPQYDSTISVSAVHKVSYSYMFSGALCFDLNETNYILSPEIRTQEYWNWDHLKNKLYSQSGPSFGQTIDDLNNISNCAKLYPEPNQYNDSMVYSVGSSWKTSYNSNFGINFSAYKDTLVDSACYSNMSADSVHNRLFSNFATSSNGVQRGIHVNVWHKDFDGTTLKEKLDNNASGSINVLTHTGDVLDNEDYLLQNDGASRSMANDYSCYYSMDNGSDKFRDFSIVCKPKDGNVISWIAVDGVIRNRNDYNFGDYVGKYNSAYNIIKTTSLSSNCSHTIDVGFATVEKPKIKDGVYQISNYPELLWFAKDVNSGHNSDKAELVNDVEASFTSANGGWDPIGTEALPFKGSFNGNNHKILGLAKSSDYENVAFIRQAKDAKVSNVTLEAINFVATGSEGENKDERTVAGLIAVADGVNVSDVHVKGIIQSAGNRMGGLIGFINSSNNNISRCTVQVQSNAAVCKTGHVGGVVGYINNNTDTVIDQCINISNVQSNTYPTGAADWTTDYAGGIVGYCDCGQYETKLYITNCINKGTIHGDSAGGILGDFRDDYWLHTEGSSCLKIQDCNNLGNISGDYCGGILGRVSHADSSSGVYSIDWCNNFGSVGTANYKLRSVGGIVGDLDDSDIKLDMNYNMNFGLIYAGGGFTTSLSPKSQAIIDTSVEALGIGVYYFTENIIYGAFVGPQVAVAMTIVFGTIAAVEFIARTIMTFVVELRDAVRPKAGGIIARVRSAETLNLSNIMNYGSVSSADKSNGICADVDSSLKNVVNVYSVESKAHSDNSNDMTKHGFRYMPFSKFKDGTVTNQIEESNKAGYWYDNGIAIDYTKTGVNKNNIKESKVLKIVYGKTPTTYYFGQNIDVYGNDVSISAIPIYLYKTNKYTVWKCPDDMTDIDDLDQKEKISSGRSFYTNFRNLASITLRDFGNLHFYGQYSPENFAENENVQLDENDQNSNEIESKNSQSFSTTTSNLKMASYQREDNIDSNDNTLDLVDSNDESAHDSDENVSESNEDNSNNDLNSDEDVLSFNFSKESYSKLKDYFEFEVTGGSSIGNIPSLISCDENDEKNTQEKFEKIFQMFHKESINAKITPKPLWGQKYSIKRIDLPSSENNVSKFYIFENDKWTEVDPAIAMSQNYCLRIDYGKQTLLSDDGTVQDIYNPQYLIKKDNSNSIMQACDYKVIYKTDGSVEISITDGIESHDDFIVNVIVSKDPTHIHEVPDTGAKMLFRAWDGVEYNPQDKSTERKDILPTNPGVYYLTRDLDISDTWVVPAGKIYLCLNGHKINLKNGAYIDISKYNSNLQICDCKHGSHGVFWKYNEESESDFIVRKTDEKEGDRIINGGLIYTTNENNKNAAQIFDLGPNSTLRIDNVNIFQLKNVQNVVKINNIYDDNKYNLTLNSHIYESKYIKENDNKRIIYLSTIQDNIDFENVLLSSINFGDKFEHKKASEDQANNSSDIYTLNTNSSLNIKFFDNCKFEKPIVLETSTKDSASDFSLNLTTDFDKFVSKGINYSSVFKLKNNNDSNVIALTSLDDIKVKYLSENANLEIGKDVDEVHKLPTETYNNICVCSKNLTQNLDLEIEGQGKVFPKFEESEEDNNTLHLTYKKGSKAKFIYSSDELTMLNKSTCYQTSLSSFDAKEAGSSEIVNYPKDTTLFYNEKINKNINASGNIIVNNVDKILNNKEYYLLDTQKVILPQSDVDCTTKLYFEFVSTKHINMNNGRWNIWTDSSKLPNYEDIVNAKYDGGQSNYDNIHYFKLDCDVYVQQTWFSPDTKIVIDLNGHIVSYDKRYDVMSNNNLIIINDSKSLVSFVDSSLMSDNPIERFFKKDDDGLWEKVEKTSTSVDGACSVKGGLIYGGKVTSRSYPKTQDSAGAIVVNRGILNFFSGNICFNSSEGCMGGSAITVKDKAKCYIYSGATISNNEIAGDALYESNSFAAGIACEGYLYNEGKIINNTTNNCAASAVSVVEGEFVNNGVVSNNKSELLEHKPDNYRNPFSTIYIDNKSVFTNTGLITDNTANFRQSAVLCQGSMTISENSQIYNNYWSITDQKDKAKETETDTKNKEPQKHILDINNNKPIKIDGKLNYIDGHQSVLSYKLQGQVITKDWESTVINNMSITVDKVFKIENIEALDSQDKDKAKEEDKSNSIVLAIGRDNSTDKNEVKVTTQSRVCKLDFWYFMEGEKEKLANNPNYCNLNSYDRYICGENINVVISPSETIKVTAIKIGDEDINASSEHINRFTYNFRGWGEEKDSQGICLLPMMITLKTFDPYAEAQRKKEYDQKFSTWNKMHSLPISEGCYKLDNDVVVENAWHPAAGNIIVDLNGYSITVDKENENVIYMDNPNTNLQITDSSILYGPTKVHYLVKNDRGYEVLKDDPTKYNNKVLIKGGFIGNAHFSNKSSTYKSSGAIFIEKGKFYLEAGNVVANSINNIVEAENGIIEEGQGASAIFVGREAVANLGDKTNGQYVNIAYNYSTCIDKQYRYGAAGLEIRGNCVSYAIISNNEAVGNSVAGAAVITKGSKFYHHGKIINNKASKDSVAGLLICSDNENTESKTNSQTEEVCLATNTGEISDNFATENSIAAVELYGKLLNTGEGKIIRNKSGDANSYSGIYSCGDLILDQSSQICQNYYVDNQNGIKYEDIVFDEDNYSGYTVSASNNKETNALFTFGKNYNPSLSTYSNTSKDGAKPYSLTHVGVNNYDTKSGKTLLLAKGFISNNRKMQDINSYFEVIDSEYDISATEDGCIYYGYSSDNAYLHVSSNDGGTVNCLGDTVTPKVLGVNVDIKAEALPGYHIESVVVNNQNISINNNKLFNYSISNTEDKTIVEIKFAADFGSIERHNVAGNFVEWTSNVTLPTISGCFKLMNDVFLTQTWCVPKVYPLILDLNGHNITINSNQPIMRLNEKDTSLDIIDTCTDNKVKCKFKKDDSGKYIRSADGNISYTTGCLYGGSAYDGGCIYVSENTYMSVKNINIVGNEAVEDGGAVYNNGDFVLGKNASIVGNASQTGAAIYNSENAVLQVDGIIKNNVATKNAAGIFANGILQMCDNAIIGNNVVLKLDKNKKVTNAIETKATYSDIVFKEYSDKDSKGSIIKIFPTSNTLKNKFNNDNMCLYASCMRHDSEEIMYTIQLPIDPNMFMPDPGLYVPRADGFYDFIYDKTSNKYIPSKNPSFKADNKPIY